MTTAQELIWNGAGRPIVKGPDGIQLKMGHYGQCAYCGKPAVYKLDKCMSASFTIAKAMYLGAEGVCESCGFCLRDLRLRCAPWCATAVGVEFALSRGKHLEMLLSPPEPPFVMGWPVMGPKKGGVTNFPYTPAWDPAKEEQKIHPEKGRMVTKIQSKHVAIFAQTAWDKDHYPVVTDDNMVFWLDRKLWEFLSGHIAKVLEIVPVPCLREWTPPTGNDWREGTIRWKELTDPLEPYRSAAWWQLLIDVSPRPDRTKKAETVTVGCNEQLSLV